MHTICTGRISAVRPAAQHSAGSRLRRQASSRQNHPYSLPTSRRMPGLQVSREPFKEYNNLNGLSSRELKFRHTHRRDLLTRRRRLPTTARRSPGSSHLQYPARSRAQQLTALFRQYSQVRRLRRRARQPIAPLSPYSSQIQTACSKAPQHIGRRNRPSNPSSHPQRLRQHRPGSPRIWEASDTGAPTGTADTVIFIHDANASANAGALAACVRSDRRFRLI